MKGSGSNLIFTEGKSETSAKKMEGEKWDFQAQCKALFSYPGFLFARIMYIIFVLVVFLNVV